MPTTRGEYAPGGWTKPTSGYSTVHKSPLDIIGWIRGLKLKDRKKEEKIAEKQNYYTIEQMLDMIDEPNQTACIRILTDNRRLFQTIQGSTNNHQNWPGGYFDHVQEVMNIGVVLYERLDSLRPLPFSLSDLLLVVYLHDIEKPWKYELREDGQLYHKAGMQNKEDHQRFRMVKLAEYGIQLTVEQENGLQYVEGEFNDYTNRRRVMGPLACVAHMCDVASARLWLGHPMPENDPWVWARRIRD